jgi:hypothetical protein
MQLWQSEELAKQFLHNQPEEQLSSRLSLTP